MPFRASRVRIQIPCGRSGSIVDPGATPNRAFACDGGCSDSPQSAVCPFFGVNPWDEVVNPHEQFLLLPEDLPLFKRALELKMKALGLADEASALAKKRIGAKLADVARVEKKLGKGSKR
jgi:hypothetical protein